ncbi:ArsA family ATPase [uncultured Jatrophihabitans sp.]|uniref:ArsA family ATPase n=1 Tax=uncultured Jatrophihabitans sp. TaxID=1610747 RepID=UPI0035CA08FA
MRVLLFTGKGGVGKTTAAAATALRLADRGARTLLLSTDTAHSLGDALDTSLGDAPTEVAANLWAVQIDTQGRLEAAWRDVQSYLTDMLTRGGVDPITADELTVLPGVDEVLALLAVRELAVSGTWDAVVVDCAPTAETLRLLALPEALRWYLQRVFPAQRKIARGVRTVATLLGRGDAVPPDSLFETLLRLNDELASVRELLGDPTVTSVRLVLTPEAVVVAEARRTFTALALFGYRVDSVIANRVFPDGGDEWRQAWVRAQRVQLDAVRESFGTIPVQELPYRPGEPVGVDALRDVAAELYGALPGVDPAAETPGPPPLRVDPDGAGGFVLSIPLPLAQRHDVDAVRAGDDLVVSVGGNRRILTLPSMLRRCVVSGGSFDGAQLHVRFAPEEPEAPGARGRPRPTPGGRTEQARHD